MKWQYSYIYSFYEQQTNGNKGVDEMGQKTVDEMGLDEMGSYRGL